MVPSATLSLTLSQVEHYPSKGCGQIDDLTAETICLRRLPVESALISVAPGWRRTIDCRVGICFVGDRVTVLPMTIP